MYDNVSHKKKNLRDTLQVILKDCFKQYNTFSFFYVHKTPEILVLVIYEVRLKWQKQKSINTSFLLDNSMKIDQLQTLEIVQYSGPCCPGP